MNRYELNILNEIYRSIVRTFMAILKIHNYSNCNQLLIFLLKTNDKRQCILAYEEDIWQR